LNGASVKWFCVFEMLMTGAITVMLYVLPAPRPVSVMPALLLEQ
jgi:hypothetical protein